MNIYRLCAIKNTRFYPILNYSDTAEFYQCPQTHLQCSPNCEFHTPNSPFVPPTVIRGKYIAVMWMYSVIILISHASYTKSLELWNDNLIIKFDFLIGTDICSSIGPFCKPLGVCQRYTWCSFVLLRFVSTNFVSFYFVPLRTFRFISFRMFRFASHFTGIPKIRGWTPVLHLGKAFLLLPWRPLAYWC
jgi:hypothetical protein